jgi:uncharacterized protein
MHYRTEHVTMWFDRRLVFRKSSIHRVGTFTTDDIKAGETLIWVTGGLVITPADRETGNIQIDGEMYNEERLGDGVTIITPKVFNYYLNHSCAPNVVDQSKHATWTHYIALRDIQAQEELVADYYVYGEGSLEVCECQSPRCRWPRPTS